MLGGLQWFWVWWFLVLILGLGFNIGSVGGAVPAGLVVGCFLLFGLLVAWVGIWWFGFLGWFGLGCGWRFVNVDVAVPGVYAGVFLSFRFCMWLVRYKLCGWRVLWVFVFCLVGCCEIVLVAVLSGFLWAVWYGLGFLFCKCRCCCLCG